MGPTRCVDQRRPSADLVFGGWRSRQGGVAAEGVGLDRAAKEGQMIARSLAAAVGAETIICCRCPPTLPGSLVNYIVSHHLRQGTEGPHLRHRGLSQHPPGARAADPRAKSQAQQDPAPNGVARSRHHRQRSAGAGPGSHQVARSRPWLLADRRAFRVCPDPERAAGITARRNSGGRSHRRQNLLLCRTRQRQIGAATGNGPVARASLCLAQSPRHAHSRVFPHPPPIKSSNWVPSSRSAG